MCGGATGAFKQLGHPYLWALDEARGGDAVDVQGGAERPAVVALTVGGVGEEYAHLKSRARRDVIGSEGGGGPGHGEHVGRGTWARGRGTYWAWACGTSSFLPSRRSWRRAEESSTSMCVTFGCTAFDSCIWLAPGT